MSELEEPAAERRLDGQSALITGAAGAVGRATALALHRAGARVILADLRADAVAAVASLIQSEGGTALAWCGDLTAPSELDRLVDDAYTFAGSIEILVNSAGRIHTTPLLELPLDLWRSVFAVNVDAPLLLLQAMARRMQRNSPHPLSGCRGKIINVSSPAAEVGRPLLAAYGASKAALNHLSRSAALVLADDLISVTVLYPGSILEGMMGAVAADLGVLEGRTAAEVLQERVAGMPLGRFQYPKEVAHMALYIAAYHGMGLNGQLLWSEAHLAQL